MEEKTLILEVDLSCHRCNKKIRKTVCKLQDRENIRSIVYDEKKNNVLVSGPFDPNRLSRKLRCLACKVIKNIQLQKPPPKTEPPKPEVKPPPPPKTEPPKTEVVVWPFVPVCWCPPGYYGGCKCGGREPPCHGGGGGGCRCGRECDSWRAPPPPVYGCPYRTCQFICEEDRWQCRIM